MQSDADNGTHSTKRVFFAIIAVILLGTAFWYVLTLWAAEPVAPDVAKEFAEDFERECFLQVHDEEECKELTGANHLDCIEEATERVDEGEGDGGNTIEHNRDAYLECMAEATGVDAR